MCQEVIDEFLSDCPTKWFTVKEIVDGTGLSPNSAFNSCMDMRRSKQVLYRKERRLVGKCYKDIIVYKHKRC
jgi:hypothetical protein